MKKRIWYVLGGTVLGVLVVVMLLATAMATRAAPLQATAPTSDPKASQLCVDCHSAGTPKIVEQYEKSKHAESGGAACLDCHAADEDDWDATEHYGNLTIGTNPTPKDCEQCHKQEVTEFNRSKHAALAMIFFSGLFDRTVFTVAGYDEEPEEVAYHIWHHAGRRYRHGALMMAADYTQWHGIWDLQKGLVEIIRYAADHGLPEGEAWMKSDDPDKFWLYPFYDVPGSAWGIDTIAYRKSDEHTTKILANREGWEDYWDTAYANVKAAYEHGLLSDEQWELVEALYADIDRENGQIFDLPKLYDTHKAGKATDDEAVKTQVLELKLPGKAGWEYKK